MIEIRDVKDLLPPGLLESMAEDAIYGVIANIAEAARAEWIRVAQAELNSSRRDYMNGIQQVRMQKGMAVITLLGVVPNMVEQGSPATDMHETLLGPRVPVVPMGDRGKHRNQEGGYFRAIPFRHVGPNAGGMHGQPFGKPYSGHAAVADSKALGEMIYDHAKGLIGSTSMPGEGMRYGGRLPAGLAPKLKAYHATDIYAGLIKVEKTYAKATQSQYMTFRTISVDANNQPTGRSPWIRPQQEGRHLSKKVMDFVDQITPKAFDAYFRSQK